jgi:hypothetical protein
MQADQADIAGGRFGKGRCSEMNQMISVALKEWAVVVEAVLEGRQCLLLRKGELREVHREYKADHPGFLLYPTYEEQRPEQLLPAWHEKLRRIEALRPDGSHVILKGYCEVEAVWHVRNVEKLQEPSPRMIWSLEYLREVYPEETVFCALLVRAHRLAQAREIADPGRYAKCRTWVDLLDEISIEGARPVVTDEAFRRQAGELHRLLG